MPPFTVMYVAFLSLNKQLFILFLFRQEKNQKKPSKGALRANAPPLQSPAASPEPPQYLVVPYRAVSIARYGRGTQGRVYLAPGGDINASPVPISLVPFLLGNKKVT